MLFEKEIKEMSRQDLLDTFEDLVRASEVRISDEKQSLVRAEILARMSYAPPPPDMSITLYLYQFKGGDRVMFLNGDRKNHIYLRFGEIFTAGDPENPINRAGKSVVKQFKITYNQWRNRWAK